MYNWFNQIGFLWAFYFHFIYAWVNSRSLVMATNVILCFWGFVRCVISINSYVLWHMQVKDNVANVAGGGGGYIKKTA